MPLGNGRRVRFRAGLVRWFLYAALVLLLQWIAGAHRVGFIGGADAPGHYVTGLMTRDYIARGFPGSPMRFARNYYAHYPEIGFGHWPPWLYVVQAAWTLIFPATRPSLLVLLALSAASTAAALDHAVRRYVSARAATIAAVLFLLLPISQSFDSIWMAENVLALFTLLSLLALAHTISTESTIAAVAFGVLASATILTKGNGWMLGLVPIPAVVLAGRTRRLWGRLGLRLCLAGAIVVVLCVPFYALTLRMARAGMEHRTLSAAWITTDLFGFGTGLWSSLGGAILAAAACGMAVALLGRGRRRRDPFWAVMLMALPAAVALNIAVLTAAEPRKLYPVFSVILIFAALGVEWIAARRAWGAFPVRWRAPLLALAIVALFFAQVFQLVRYSPSGVQQAAALVRAQPNWSAGVILVAATEPGMAGAFIAEVAEHDPRRPSYFVARASKLLAHQTWNALDYRSLYPTAAAMRQALDALPVSFLVVQQLPEGARPEPHQETLEDMLKTYAADWNRIYAGPDFTIYRRKRDLRGVPVRIRMDLGDSLGTTLTYGR
jgi:4-amino-4-deoxy-L-arabinose transferase-like glycosyltransferase